MSNNQVVSSPQTTDPDDEVLQFTQSKRMEIVNKLTAKGIPTDSNDDMGNLLKTLDGMDRVALGRKRIKADEGIAGANQAAAAAVIATLLQKANSGGAKPFQSDTLVDREIPVLGNDIPAPVLVDGETETAPSQMSYDGFMAKYQQT